MSETDINADDHGDALPVDLQAEADALLADDLAPGEGPTAPAADTGDVDTAGLVAGLLDITFNGLIAPKRGGHWQLSQDESASLGQAYGAVIDKYFPNVNAGCEVTALIISVAVFAPRLAEDARLASDQDDADEPIDSNQDAAALDAGEKFGFEGGSA